MLTGSGMREVIRTSPGLLRHPAHQTQALDGGSTTHVPTSFAANMVDDSPQHGGTNQ